MADMLTRNRAPGTTQPGVYFTMVSMEQDSIDAAPNKRVITELVVPVKTQEGTESQYLPMTPNSSYAPGMISSAIQGNYYSGFEWAAAAPLQNNAAVNQARFLTSLGSVVMNFNLSQNMRILTDHVHSSAPQETASRTKLELSLELEQAVCNAIVSSTKKNEFVAEVQEQVDAMETHATTLVLGNIYDTLQQLNGTGFDDFIYGQEADWVSIANGNAPEPPSSPRNFDNSSDPISDSTLVAVDVSPTNTRPASADTQNSTAIRNGGEAPSFVLYEERSPSINGAVLVNNLIRVGGRSVNGY